jgi:hypothetical protein
MAYQGDLSRAFVENQTVNVQGMGLYQLRLFSPGSLVLTSGKVLACDPLAFWQHEPFERPIATGSYPVILSLAKDLERGGERTAFARLQIRENEIPVRWEMALKPGQDMEALAPDHFWGYGVDAGMGCFMDSEGVATWQVMVDNNDAVLLAQMEAEPVPEDLISFALRKNSLNRTDWSNFVIDPISGRNVIIFGSGWGDGSYPSYWGFNVADEVVCLVTDFCMLDND